MKKVYVKIALLAIVGMVHSSSMGMLQKREPKVYQKQTKDARELALLVQQKGLKLDLSRLPLDGTIQDNCFTQLPQDLRKGLYVSLRPSLFKNPFFVSSALQDPIRRDRLDRRRKLIWLGPIVMLSSTCTSCRSVMIHEDQELATYLRELSVDRTLGYIGNEDKKTPEAFDKPINEQQGSCLTQ